MTQTWKVKARMTTGKAAEWVENGIRTYSPGKIEWVVIREFDDFIEADDWLCDYVNENGYNITDFNIVKS